MIVLRAGDQYDIKRFSCGARRDQIQFLACRFCNFMVDVVALRKVGDKSGAGRYCRARGKMVKHYHAEHKASNPA